MQLSFRCARRWEELRAIEGRRDVRYCDDCRNAVHCVASRAEFDAHAAAGHCVAFFDERGDRLVGRPATPYAPDASWKRP
jgi:hypothetical protein